MGRLFVAATIGAYVAPALGTLSLSVSAFTKGTTATVNILGATAGSTIAGSSLPTGFTVNSSARTLAYDGTGSVGAGTLSLVETPSGGGSSNTSMISYSLAAAVPTAPTVLTAPTISGTATEGQTLTYATGTYTGSPTLTGQWLRGTTAISGATGGTYVLVTADVGASISYRQTATNATGSVQSTSNAIGPILSGTLSSTNATATSATGAALAVQITMGADIYDGYILHVQRTTSQGVYTAPTMDVQHYVTVSEREAGELGNTSLVDDGYTPASGTGWEQYRWEREDGALGPWTEVGFVVNSSVATWASTTGVNKNQYLTINAPYFQAYHNAGVGAACGVRSSVAKSGKGHFEVSLDGFYNSSGSAIYIGVTDGTTAVGPAVFPIPGNSISGAAMQFLASSGFAQRYENGGSLGGPAIPGGVPLPGDKIVVEFDTTANTVSWWIWRVASNTSAQIGTTVTLTAGIPAAWHGYAAGQIGGADGTNSDKFTANFGASTFSRTSTSGYAGW